MKTVLKQHDICQNSGCKTISFVTVYHCHHNTRFYTVLPRALYHAEQQSHIYPKNKQIPYAV